MWLITIAKKTMCSDSLEGCSRAAPTVAPNTPRRRRRGGGEVMKSNRDFPFKVEAVGVPSHVESVCLSELGSLELKQRAAQLLH